MATDHVKLSKNLLRMKVSDAKSDAAGVFQRAALALALTAHNLVHKPGSQSLPSLMQNVAGKKCQYYAVRPKCGCNMYTDVWYTY